MNITQPDYPGRSREALEDIFDGLIADIQEQWRVADAAKSKDQEPPEPMLGAMRQIIT